MAIAGALVYPSIVALNTAGDSVQFLGLPVVMMSYTGSVIPIIVAVWLQGHLERLLKRVLPSVVRNFTTPLLTLVVMVPLVLLTVGPLTMYASQGLSAGIEAMFGFAPWLAGAIMGGLWQVFVLFGLHWGFVPLMTNDLATQGYSLLMGPLVSAVLAQAAATLAVLFRSRNLQRREVAGPAALSGFLAGITEPGIYGVNLPLKRPFYFGIAGGAVGGAIAASGGSAASAFAFPSLLALPAFTEVGSFTLQLIGVGTAVAIAFVLTLLFVDRESENAGSAPAPGDGVDASSPEDAAPVTTSAGGGGAATAVMTRTVDVLAPVSGRTVSLSDVPDKVFSSRALGEGMGIVPTEGRVYAPVSGKVMAAMKAGHAYGIKSPEGVEVLVHVGIDTVNLGGEGFRPAVRQGQDVEAGDLLVEVDLDLVAKAGYDTTTLFVVTNTAQLAAVTPVEGESLEHGSRALRVRV
jgi:PTS system beta-glucosides-specific IIC component